MLILVTYDVNTETAAGRKRLRKVAKVCVNHGQRVQNSVFECLLDAAQYVMFKAELTALIDPDQDSLRFYRFMIPSYMKFLNPGGTLLFEIGYDQGEAVKEICIESGVACTVCKDLSGNDRVAIIKAI